MKATRVWNGPIVPSDGRKAFLDGLPRNPPAHLIGQIRREWITDWERECFAQAIKAPMGSDGDGKGKS